MGPVPPFAPTVGRGDDIFYWKTEVVAVFYKLYSYFVGQRIQGGMVMFANSRIGKIFAIPYGRWKFAVAVFGRRFLFEKYFVYYLAFVFDYRIDLYVLLFGM